MESFWLKCRKESELSLGQMSKLLNISAHTYCAMEQGRIKFYPEIVQMLCMIYNISSTSKADETQVLMSIKKQFATLDERERFYVAMKNITGEGSYSSNYRKIRRIKDSILK